MSETPRLGLTYLESGQAQKHVTVNEALARIDVLAAPAAASRSFATPPTDAAEGALHVVGPNAAGDWAGADGSLAAKLNGGWALRPPEAGRRLWIVDEGREIVFDGVAWREGSAVAACGAAIGMRVIAIDHPVASGGASETLPFIPDKAVVVGVTGRVLETLEGVATWRLGAPGAADRYGSGIGAEAGAHVVGVTGQPTAYFGGSGLRLEPEGGAAFSTGLVRLCAHVIEIQPPRAE